MIRLVVAMEVQDEFFGFRVLGVMHVGVHYFGLQEMDKS